MFDIQFIIPTNACIFEFQPIWMGHITLTIKEHMIIVQNNIDDPLSTSPDSFLQIAFSPTDLGYELMFINLYITTTINEGVSQSKVVLLERYFRSSPLSTIFNHSPNGTVGQHNHNRIPARLKYSTYVPSPYMSIAMALDCWNSVDICTLNFGRTKRLARTVRNTHS
jgi:hypothetical protein